MSEAAPKEVIIDTHRVYSPLRVFLKKQIAKLLGTETPEVFYVFGILSETEQKAFIIQKAFSSSLKSPLLDLDFIESLIKYLAHKYASTTPQIEEKVKAVLRKHFENSNYRDRVLKLDSLEYSGEVVLNPPPLKKPLLSNVILPMVKEQEKKLIPFETQVAEIETWKYFFMRIVDNLCEKKCAVLFIGVLQDTEYATMIIEGLRDFGSLVVSGRGKYIVNMDNTFASCCQLEKTNPSEEPIFTSSERKDIIGMWEFPDEESVPCHWGIFIVA